MTELELRVFLSFVQKQAAVYNNEVGREPAACAIPSGIRSQLVGAKESRNTIFDRRTIRNVFPGSERT